MELYLKIAAGLLLLVQAFHLAALQDSTDSPGRTIDPSWLRELVKNTAGSSNAEFTEEGTEYYPETETSTNDEPSSGIASGSMTVLNREEENLTNGDENGKETSEDATVVTTTEIPTSSAATTTQPELPDATVSPTTTTTDSTSQVNMTEVEEEFNNSTTTPPSAQSSTTPPSAQSSTSFPDHSSQTDIETTTLAPETNATQESTTKPDDDTGLSNATESNNTTPVTTTTTTTTTPEIKKTSTTPSSTTVFLSETTEKSPETTAAASPNTPEKANNTINKAASGSGSERGLASDPNRSQRHSAWGVVLGTAVAVAIVGLVAYVILKKRNQKAFSHRKLVEEFPSDPVLRLDNNEPLDLNFGGSAYYNPGLQGDNIQMTSFPGRH